MILRREEVLYGGVSKGLLFGIISGFKSDYQAVPEQIEVLLTEEAPLLEI
jgi:hypothetical protein